MAEYHKIDSIYKRDPNTNYQSFLHGEYSRSEFYYLKNNIWTWTEKIDGTNIRAIISSDGSVKFGGRTDKASIPPKLLANLTNLFSDKEKNKSIFPVSWSDEKTVIIYGEGYGAGIQKGGGLYSLDQKFIVFDINFNGWWAPRFEVEEICNKLSLDRVLVIGSGTLNEAEEAVKGGIFSALSLGVEAEGLVLRPLIELKGNNKDRIITKIKHKDFEKCD